MSEKGTLIFFCGKMGAGKSTKAREIADWTRAILLSEDDWLAALYPGEIRGLEDYVKYSSRLKPILKNHVRDILNAGVSVVMDFPANTRSQRAWFKEIFTENNVPHKLIFLDVEDRLCLERIKQRGKAHPERSRFDTEETFRRLSVYFQEPSEDEGFEIKAIGRSNAQ